MHSKLSSYTDNQPGVSLVEIRWNVTSLIVGSNRSQPTNQTELSLASNSRYHKLYSVDSISKAAIWRRGSLTVHILNQNNKFTFHFL